MLIHRGASVAPRKRKSVDRGHEPEAPAVNTAASACSSAGNARRVIYALQMAFGKNRELKEIAADLGISESWLEHLCTTALGMSPHKFVKGMRLLAADHLFETTTYSVKEVQAQVGYSDASHFSRDFLKLFGRSPSQTRAAYRARAAVAASGTAPPDPR